jgi:hypothetical protein
MAAGPGFDKFGAKLYILRVDLIVLKASDQDAILNFERERSSLSHSDPMEFELSSWKARWRPEQLTHYLPMGWSFGAWDKDRLLGYILTQPLLFFRGLTQTLWVEHLSYAEPSVGEALVEAAYKWARDKHFQTVLFSNLPKELKLSRPTTTFTDDIVEMTSSRRME